MAQELVGAIVGLLNPVVFIPIILIFSIFFLIGMAIMGWDKGAVLVRMGHRRFARGLITYLFCSNHDRYRRRRSSRWPPG